MTDNQKFFAWLDGELEGAEAAEMERRVASNLRLTALAQKHRAMNSRLRSAFAQVAEAPVPEHLHAAATATQPNVFDFEAARRNRATARPPQWALIAATLVVGIFVGALVPDRSDGPIEVEDGMLYAAGALDHEVDTQLASAPADGELRVGITFRGATGSICRTFAGEAVTGLACRDGSRWHVRGLFPAEAGQQGDYRMAAGMNPALAELVDSTMVGEPFSAREEVAAKERNWR